MKIFFLILIFILRGQISYGADISEKRLAQFQLEKLNEDASSLEFTDMNHKTIRLTDYRGSLVLLHLWASWCLPCRKEIPRLVEFVDKIKNKDVQLLLVSIDKESKRQEVQKFLSEMKSAQSAFLLSENHQSQKYHAWGVPTTYLIDQKSKIVARAMGSKAWENLSTSDFEKFLSESFLK